jgi:hypothetical protein
LSFAVGADREFFSPAAAGSDRRIFVTRPLRKKFRAPNRNQKQSLVVMCRASARSPNAALANRRVKIARQKK